jgi:hypothetical protein
LGQPPSIFTGRLPSTFNYTVPRCPTRSTAALRDDGVENVAAFTLVEHHAQALSIPAIETRDHGYESFTGKRDTVPGRQEPSRGKGARLSGAQSLQSKLVRDIDAVVVTRFWCPATVTPDEIRSWLS